MSCDNRETTKEDFIAEIINLNERISRLNGELLELEAKLKESEEARSELEREVSTLRVSGHGFLEGLRRFYK